MSDAHGVARDQLRAFIERIERLEEEKKTIADDIKDVYGEAKAMGYDTKIMKKVIGLRKKDDQERAEEELVLDTYLAALGMIPQIEMFDPKEVKPASREERRRQIMSEDMADHKSLVDEMADAGLISEEARHENKALADAVATKFGNGPAQALQSPRKAAEAVSERTATGQAAGIAFGLSENLPETANEVPAQDGEGTGLGESLSGKSDTARPTSVDAQPNGRGSAGQAEESVVTVVGTESGTVANSPETATEKDVSAKTDVVTSPSVESVSPQADEATTGSSDANAGGDDVDSSAPRAGLVDQTLNIGEGERELIKALPGNLTMEADPPVPMKRASFAHCFPELSKIEYDRLAASISQIGIDRPIVRKGEVILDGWSRYNIARSLGERYPVIEYDGSDELLDVIALQRSSRDWTTAQEAKIAKLLAKELPDRADDIWAAFHIAELPDGEVVAA